MIPLWQVALKPQAVYNLDNIILYFVVHSGNVQQIGPTKIGLTTQERENQVKKKKAKVLPSDSNSPNKTATTQERQNQVKKKQRFCHQITTAQIGLTTQERQSQVKKKAKVLPSDNNSPNRTDYPRETESGEKKAKVLPSDGNSPNRTDYPRETESGEKKGKVLPSDITARIGLTTQERQNQVKKNKGYAFR